MELVEGRTLRALLREGRLPNEAALRVARDVARGLAKIHELGIVHRDLKPENVMIDDEGHAKVLDFGLAVLRKDEPAPSAAGTPGYMSPEQAAGREIDARTDVFSFGLVL